MSEERKKTYVLGTISIDQDGVWYVSPVSDSPNAVALKSPDIVSLLKKVSKNLVRAKSKILEEIREIQASVKE